MVTNRIHYWFCQNGNIRYVNDLLLKSYGMSNRHTAFLATFVILSLICTHKKIPQTKGRTLKSAIFIMYIFTALYYTGVGNMFDLQRYGIRIQLNADQVNLLPFSKDIDIVGIFS